jgi:hypothetical protein
MSKLMIALGSMLPQAAKGRSCPDCGGEMQGGECCDCGYGGEEESDDSEDKMEMQTLLDAKKAVQNAMELIDRLIVNKD